MRWYLVLIVQHTEKHCVAMGSIIEGFRDRWVAIMKVSSRFVSSRLGVTDDQAIRGEACREEYPDGS